MCENRTSFYKCLDDLDKKTVNLRNKYVRLRFLSIFLPLFSFFIILLLLKGIISLWDIRDLLSIHTLPSVTIEGVILTIIMILIYQTVFISSIRNFREDYTTALNLSNEIVDTADWTTFRKRQETDNKRIKVRNAVDDFYLLRRLKFFPYHTGVSIFGTWHLIYKLSYYIIMLELAMVMTIFIVYDIFI